MTTSRRHFIQRFSLSGVALTFVGCASRKDGDGSALAADEAEPGVQTVTMKDILMEGWSTLGSGFLGNNGPLKAQLVEKNKTVVLTYVQDSHGHKFTLTPAQFFKLRQGKIVDVLTTEAEGHKHIVRINPARVIESSSGITMPVAMPDGDVPPPPPLGPNGL